MLRLGLVMLCAVGLVVGAGCEDPSSTSSYADRVRQERIQRDMQMREKTSVLAPRWREDFQGLDYYAVDSTYRFVVALRRQSEPDSVALAENTGRLQTQLRIGQVMVSLPSGDERLTVFRGESDGPRGRLWIPFADATNGGETYKAGRYVDLERVAEDSVVVDFNRAYNPTCVYNPDYACPLPPDENRVEAPIPAGEKVPKFRGARSSTS